MKQFTDADVVTWSAMVGKQVMKKQKPFKSGRKVNTVKALVKHEQTGNHGFTFEEDDSVVECWRCSLAP